MHTVFLHVEICKDHSSSPYCVSTILYFLEKTIECDNSLDSSIKMLFHHFIEIILNNLSGSLASLEVFVIWWQNIQVSYLLLSRQHFAFSFFTYDHFY